MISNNGLGGAREIIGRLRTNDLLPLCPQNAAGPQNASGPQNAAGSSPAEVPTSASPFATDTSVPAIPTTTGTPLPEEPSEPGVDCRTVG
jgi:protein phosphatase